MCLKENDSLQGNAVLTLKRSWAFPLAFSGASLESEAFRARHDSLDWLRCFDFVKFTENIGLPAT